MYCLLSREGKEKKKKKREQNLPACLGDLALTSQNGPEYEQGLDLDLKNIAETKL